MNLQEFEARYELIERVTEGDIESHHALHRSGVVVMVHFVSGIQEFRERVGRAADRLSTAGGDDRILESHEIDDRLVIVTRFLRDFQSLEAWLGESGFPVAEGAATQAEPVGAGSEDDSPDEGAGEFTSMFMAASPDAPGAETRAPAGAAPSPTDSDEPSGEFTSMFNAADSDTVGPDVGASTDSALPELEPDEPLGEFTAMFSAADPGAIGSDATAPTDSALPKSPPDEPLGEFTSMFKAGDAHAPRDDTAVARDSTAAAGGPPPSADSGVPDEGGEFTQLFQAAGAAQDSESDLAPERAEGVADERLFRDRLGAGEPSSPEAPAPRSATDPFAPPPKEETGEFTRFFRAGGEAEAPIPSEAPLDWSNEPIAGRTREPEARPAPAHDPDWSEALRAERPEVPRGASSPPPPAVDRNAEAPGEFTRIFGAELDPRATGGGRPSPPPSRPTPPASGATPPASGATPPAPREAGAPLRPAAPAPKASKPSGSVLPDPEAMIRKGRVPKPRPPRFRPPSGRRLARKGVKKAALAMIGGDEATDGGGDQATSGQRSRISSSTLGVALVTILLVTVGVVAFFALWDFQGSVVDEETPAMDSTAVEAPASEA
jgi:hypothetical protein